MPHRIIYAVFVIWMLAILSVNASDNWYSGAWDSHMHVSLDHPKTIALRVEVEDRDTRQPLAGVEVRLEGEYEEEQRFDQNLLAKEFELKAITDRQGIAVFALSWLDDGSQKKDDLEKIQSISVRKDGYEYASKRISFSQLTRDSDNYDREAWMDMIINTKGAKYFVLMLGESFKSYQQDDCKAAAFFEKIRDEKYGQEYRAKAKAESDFPGNFIMAVPQKEAGPFMMLPIAFQMKRVFTEIQVNSGNSRPDWLEDSGGAGRRTAHESADVKQPERATEPEQESAQGDTRIGKGYITVDSYDDIEKYINKNMTVQQIKNVLGEPMQTWTAGVYGKENTMHSWHVWQSGGRMSVWIVVNHQGDVTRIEKEF